MTQRIWEIRIFLTKVANALQFIYPNFLQSISIDHPIDKLNPQSNPIEKSSIIFRVYIYCLSIIYRLYLTIISVID